MLTYNKDDFVTFLGYDNNYMVSRDGRVLSIARYSTNTNKNRFLKERLLKPTLNNGYYKVKLNNKKTMNVHRLVALTFIPIIEGKPHINHINGITTDNRVENLEWCTHQENMIHSFKFNGRSSSNKGKTNCSGSRKIHQFSKQGVLLNTYPSISEACRQLNKPIQSGATAICSAAGTRAINKTAYGYIWSYAN